MAVSRLSFGAQVDAWTRKTQQRMIAVFRTAAQMTIEEVSIRTPVDTGFLRASLHVSLAGIEPIQRAARPTVKEKGHYLPSIQPYSLMINGAEIGDTIFASFVAAYAGHVEFGAEGRPARGMVRLAAQNWQTNVRKAVAQVKAASGG